MANITNVVQVSISRETRPIGEVGFGTVLIIGPNATFSGKIKYYSEDELATLASELTGTTTTMEYIMASAIFSQTKHINRIAIGKKESGDATYAAALTAIKLLDNNWYGVLCAVRTIADQKSVVTWVQANNKVAIFATDDTDTVDKDLTADTVPSLAKYVKSGTYDRSAVIYHSLADTQAIDAAAIGYALALDPGSYTLDAKSFQGITPDTLTSTQQTNAHSKYCSTYEEIAQTNVLLEGWIGSGEFFDIITFQDWLVSKIQSNIFGVIARSQKTPFTDAGITAIENATRQALELGQTYGGISPTSFDKNTGLQTGGFSTSFPLASSILLNDKALRRLITNCKFKAWLSGAIHHVTIAGTLTL